MAGFGSLAGERIEPERGEGKLHFVTRGEDAEHFFGHCWDECEEGEAFLDGVLIVAGPELLDARSDRFEFRSANGEGVGLQAKDVGLGWLLPARWSRGPLGCGVFHRALTRRMSMCGRWMASVRGRGFIPVWGLTSDFLQADCRTSLAESGQR